MTTSSMAASVINSKGLLNAPGENNCFLNSAVQVLWHLDVFRRNFQNIHGHVCHATNSCIFCALKVIFTQFQFSDQAALPPNALREALANSFAEDGRFQLGIMDDAAECFETILLRIHSHISSQTQDGCQLDYCIPHRSFAMNIIEQAVCTRCRATSEPMTYNQLVFYASASALVNQSVQWAGYPLQFETLLQQAVSTGELRTCPQNNCGQQVEVKRTLTNHPDVVSIGLIWDSDCPDVEYVTNVVSQIATSIQLEKLFHAVIDLQTARYNLDLVAVVCYYGRHYVTFSYHSKRSEWIMFDDMLVKVVGSGWPDVVSYCLRGHYQPLLLVYAHRSFKMLNTDAAPRQKLVINGAPPPVLTRRLSRQISMETSGSGTSGGRNGYTDNMVESNGGGSLLLSLDGSPFYGPVSNPPMLNYPTVMPSAPHYPMSVKEEAYPTVANSANLMDFEPNADKIRAINRVMMNHQQPQQQARFGLGTSYNPAVPSNSVTSRAATNIDDLLSMSFGVNSYGPAVPTVNQQPHPAAYNPYYVHNHAPNLYQNNAVKPNIPDLIAEINPKMTAASLVNANANTTPDLMAGDSYINKQRVQDVMRQQQLNARTNKMSAAPSLPPRDTTEHISNGLNNGVYINTARTGKVTSAPPPVHSIGNYHVSNGGTAMIPSPSLQLLDSSQQLNRRNDDKSVTSATRRGHHHAGSDISITASPRLLPKEISTRPLGNHQAPLSRSLASLSSIDSTYSIVSNASNQSLHSLSNSAKRSPDEYKDTDAGLNKLREEGEALMLDVKAAEDRGDLSTALILADRALVRFQQALMKAVDADDTRHHLCVCQQKMLIKSRYLHRRLDSPAADDSPLVSSMDNLTTSDLSLSQLDASPQARRRVKADAAPTVLPSQQYSPMKVAELYVSKPAPAVLKPTAAGSVVTAIAPKQQPHQPIGGVPVYPMKQAIPISSHVQKQAATNGGVR